MFKEFIKHHKFAIWLFIGLSIYLICTFSFAQYIKSIEKNYQYIIPKEKGYIYNENIAGFILSADEKHVYTFGQINQYKDNDDICYLFIKKIDRSGKTVSSYSTKMNYIGYVNKLEILPDGNLQFITTGFEQMSNENYTMIKLDTELKYLSSEQINKSTLDSVWDKPVNEPMTDMQEKFHYIYIKTSDGGLFAQSEEIGRYSTPVIRYYKNSFLLKYLAIENEVSTYMRPFRFVIIVVVGYLTKTYVLYVGRKNKNKNAPKLTDTDTQAPGDK